MGRPSFAFGAQIGVRLGPLELSGRGQLFLQRSVEREGTTTTLDAFSFDLAACVPWRIDRITLGPCVRAEVGRLAASAAGAVEAQSPGAARFQALAARTARDVTERGGKMTLTGPWPAYNFVAAPEKPA